VTRCEEASRGPAGVTTPTPVETVPVPDATSPFDVWLARAERVAY